MMNIIVLVKQFVLQKIINFIETFNRNILKIIKYEFTK